MTVIGAPQCRQVNEDFSAVVAALLSVMGSIGGASSTARARFRLSRRCALAKRP